MDLGEIFNSEFWITTGVIFVLLMLSALFSGSETALTAASKARILHMEKNGDKRAKRVSRLIDDKERLIGAILLGNNLVNILASAIATSLFLNLMGDQGVFIATAVMTILVLIFAEVLPKSYAIANSERMALGVARIMGIVVFLFAPIVALVQSIVRGTLKLFGADISSIDNALSAQEEIRGAIDLHRHEGSIVKEDQHMLGSILDLDEVAVEDVMVHRKNMQMLDVASSTDELIAAVVRSPYTRLPLYQDNPENIVGVLHAKDVLRAIRRAGGQMHRFNVKRIMTKPWFVPETTSLKEQLNAFLERKTHFALVVDEYGDIQGLVTLEDILEEIVGEFTTDPATRARHATANGDGSYAVNAMTNVRSLNRAMGWSLPSSSARTLNGLILEQLEDIPEPGTHLQLNKYLVEIVSTKANVIQQVKMTPPKAKSKSRRGS